ncbi:MAG: membrane protein insertion efficiency factor YidD [bacterium]
MKAILLLAIRGYQLTLSRILPRVCRFEPSCSRYTYQTIEKYGVIKGMGLGLLRILRCNPWHPGGVDPVP